MKVRIEKSAAQPSCAAAPRSKSAAHRLLICAGLADGISTVSGVDISEDILATIDCLRAIGAEVSMALENGQETEDISLKQDAVLKVRGTRLDVPGPVVMNCRESGSTLRFLAPAATLTGMTVTLTGSATLMSRPLTVYDKLFTEKGIKVYRTDEAMLAMGKLTPGTFTVPGNISSQFVSGLLFALPLMNGDSRIVIEGRAESRPYIEMTLEALSKFGVWAGWEEDGSVLSIPGGQTYTAQDVSVEGDWSGAAFLLAIGAEVTGLDTGSSQGDKICCDYFRQLDEGAARLDITDCPDLGPVLAAYAASRHGCTLLGTRRLRYKESDRGAAMQEELAKFGVDTEIEDDSITVGSGAVAPSEVLCGHNDHRIVMALAVLCTETGGTIDGAEAVNKSFPDFFRKLSGTGVEVIREEQTA